MLVRVSFPVASMMLDGRRSMFSNLFSQQAVATAKTSLPIRCDRAAHICSGMGARRALQFGVLMEKRNGWCGSCVEGEDESDGKSVGEDVELRGRRRVQVGRRRSVGTPALLCAELQFNVWFSEDSAV